MALKDLRTRTATLEDVGLGLTADRKEVDTGMKAYLQLTKAQLLLFARNRNIVIWTLLFPIFMMLALGTLVGRRHALSGEGGRGRRGRLGGVAAIFGELEKTEGIDLVPPPPAAGGNDPQRGSGPARRGEKGLWRASCFAGGRGDGPLIALYYDKGNPAVAEIGTALIRQTVDRLNKRLVDFQPVIGVEEINVQSRPMSYIDFLVPGILSLMIMSNNLNGVAGTIASWRERGILRRMQGTPLSSATFIAGQITARILLNAVQAVAVLLVAYFVFDVHVLRFLGGLDLFHPARNPDLPVDRFYHRQPGQHPESAGPIAGLISFPMIFVGGIFFPIRNLPDFLQPLVEAIPIVHLTGALRDIMTRAPGWRICGCRRRSCRSGWPSPFWWRPGVFGGMWNEGGGSAMILGIGIDLVELERIRRFGTERMAQRILTERERAYLPRSERRILEFLAGRFAAKEAVAKAAGTGIGKLGFQDIEIIPDERSCPQVRLSPQGRAALAWDGVGAPPSLHHPFGPLCDGDGRGGAGLIGCGPVTLVCIFNGRGHTYISRLGGTCVYLTTAQEMRDLDRYAIETIGIPGVVLMENAGKAVARLLRDRLPASGNRPRPRRNRQQRWRRVCGGPPSGRRRLGGGLWLAGPEEKLTPDSRVFFQVCRNMGFPCPGCGGTPR